MSGVTPRESKKPRLVSLGWGDVWQDVQEKRLHRISQISRSTVSR